MENGLQVGVAKICYQGAEGCRWEEVRVKAKLPADMTFQTLPLGIAAASARLADAGWEPVATTPRTDVSPDRVLMKRRKQ